MVRKEREDTPIDASNRFAAVEGGIDAFMDDPETYIALLDEHKEIFKQSIANVEKSLKLLEENGSVKIIVDPISRIDTAGAKSVLSDMKRLYESSLKLLELLNANSACADGNVADQQHEIVIQTIRESKYQEVRAARAAIYVQLNQILPANAAAVYPPADFPISVPTVGAWQRMTGLSAEQANVEYISMMDQTRDAIVSDIKPDSHQDEIEEFETDSQLEEAIYTRALLEELKLDKQLFDFSGMLNNGINFVFTRTSAFGSMNYTQALPEPAELTSHLRYTNTILSRLLQFQTKYGDKVAESSKRKARELLGAEWQSAVYDAFYASLEHRMREFIALLDGHSTNAETVDIQAPLVIDEEEAPDYDGKESDGEPQEEVREYPKGPFIVSPDQFSWLDEYDSPQAFIVESETGPLLVIDARKRKIIDEYRGDLAIHSTRQPGMNSMQRRVAVAVEHIASGNTNHMTIISDIDKNKYPNIVVRCPKVSGVDSPRLYLTSTNAEASMLDADVKDLCATYLIEQVMIIIGACQKDGQLAVLGELTSKSRATLRNRGAGSI